MMIIMNPQSWNNLEISPKSGKNSEPEKRIKSQCDPKHLAKRIMVLNDTIPINICRKSINEGRQSKSESSELNECYTYQPLQTLDERYQQEVST